MGKAFFSENCLLFQKYNSKDIDFLSKKLHPKTVYEDIDVCYKFLIKIISITIIIKRFPVIVLIF